MKIGIFDSGLGGLFLMKPVVEALPAYDYVYFGDTKNLPYGDKSQEEIYIYTKRALDYLFKKGVGVVFIFCNTASTATLRRLQQEGYRALGVIIPTVETILTSVPSHDRRREQKLRIGVLATQSTVDSGKYPVEIKKLLPKAKVFQQATPLLVPMIESGNIDEEIIKNYLNEIITKKIDTLILGCTHYVILKDMIRKLLPGVQVISQDEIIPAKVADYLRRHPEIETKLSRRGRRDYLVTAHHPRLEHFGYLDRALFRLVVLHDGDNGTPNR